MIDLSGSVALIPGASGGMGREVARVFAEHGCDVALGYYSRADEAREVFEFARSLGRRARLDRVDTTSLAAVGQWTDSVTAEFGRIDILASCVGAHLPEGFGLFVKQDPETWRGIIEAQMMSFIYLSRAVLPQMVERKSGRLLTIGSDSGKVGESGVAVATAGHGGLIAFAKSISREIGRFGGHPRREMACLREHEAVVEQRQRLQRGQALAAPVDPHRRIGAVQRRHPRLS